MSTSKMKKQAKNVNNVMFLVNKQGVHKIFYYERIVLKPFIYALFNAWDSIFHQLKSITR